VDWAIQENTYSQRRARALVGMAPKTYRYAPKRADDKAIRERLRTLASERRRFGYLRLHILLARAYADRVCKPAPMRGITRTDSPYERGHFGGQVNWKPPSSQARWLVPLI
jgi:hypothetical protein